VHVPPLMKRSKLLAWKERLIMSGLQESCKQGRMGWRCIRIPTTCSQPKQTSTPPLTAQGFSNTSLGGFHFAEGTASSMSFLFGPKMRLPLITRADDLSFLRALSCQLDFGLSSVFEFCPYGLNFENSTAESWFPLKTRQLAWMRSRLFLSLWQESAWYPHSQTDQCTGILTQRFPFFARVLLPAVCCSRGPCIRNTEFVGNTVQSKRAFGKGWYLGGSHLFQKLLQLGRWNLGTMLRAIGTGNGDGKVFVGCCRTSVLK